MFLLPRYEKPVHRNSDAAGTSPEISVTHPVIVPAVSLRTKESVMPHIPIPEDLPGPRGPMTFRPETAKPLSELAEILMGGPSTLTRAERELIGTFVSSENGCQCCQSIHGALAAHLLDGNESLVAQVKCKFVSAAISEKLKALLVSAGKVQDGGKKVTTEDVERARSIGATDLEIHDTVLIAANF
jgi:uncharacterized peroxidase-related enzyme